MALGRVKKTTTTVSLQLKVLHVRAFIVQGVFFHWASPKISKYRKVNLG